MSVPLVRIDDPPAPAAGVAEAYAEGDAEPWVPAVEPDVVPPAVAPVRAVAVEMPAAPAPEETRSEEPAHVGGYATPEPTPGDAAGAAATRYCGMCGERVRVEADGLHCYLGHRLSPAHAERQRGGWLRRLFRRG